MSVTTQLSGLVSVHASTANKMRWKRGAGMSKDKLWVYDTITTLVTHHEEVMSATEIGVSMGRAGAC